MVTWGNVAILIGNFVTGTLATLRLQPKIYETHVYKSSHKDGGTYVCVSSMRGPGGWVNSEEVEQEVIAMAVGWQGPEVSDEGPLWRTLKLLTLTCCCSYSKSSLSGSLNHLVRVFLFHSYSSAGCLASCSTFVEDASLAGSNVF